MSVSELGNSTILARVGAADFALPGAAAATGIEAVEIAVAGDLAAVADEWRRFEKEADGTVFQTYGWHAAWQRHIGGPAGVRPAIVTGRLNGRLLFLLALSVEPGRLVRRLVWHASAICDYNAPLLAPEFARLLGRDRFPALFARVRQALRRDPRFRFDAVVLEKMPETLGNQPNPFLALATTPNPSGAYLTGLGTDWEKFYLDKRSSATRRRDRTKRKRLGDIGEVRYVLPEGKAEIESSLATLMEQKSKAFARMGVPDLFARPGHRAFFIDYATGADTGDKAHVSRLDVGDCRAALNFALIHRGRYYHVLASYDGGDVSKFGPGAAHLHELMRHAIEQGCTEFDFTIGDEPYKRDWSDTELKLHDHRSAATAIGFAAAVPGQAIARAKRVIKQTPFLWKATVALRTGLARLRGHGKPAALAASAPAAEEE